MSTESACRSRWSPAETDLLLLVYPDLGGNVLADYLGRTKRQVWRRAAGLSLRGCQGRFRDEATEVRVREMHAAGLSCRAITAALPDLFRGPDPVMQARKLLHRLGLKPHPDREAQERSRVALAALHGVTNAGLLKAKYRADFATRYGLPADLMLRQTQMILALTSGPLTAEKLRERVGIRYTGSRRADGSRMSYIGDLVRRGLVVRVSGEGTVNTYLLTAHALDLLAKAGTTEVA